MWCSPLNEVEQLQAQWGCSKSQHSSGFSPLSAGLDLLTSSPEIPCWDWGSTGAPLPSLLAADWDCCHGFWCVVNTAKHNSCVPIPVLSLAALSCGTLRAFPSGQAVYFRWIPLLFLPAGLLGLLENENINFQSSRGLLLSDIRALKISFPSLCFGRFGCKWRKSETGIFYWDGSSNFTCPAPAGRWCSDIWGSPGQFRINPIIPTWKDCGDYLIRKIHEEQLLLGETKGNWRNTSIFQTTGSSNAKPKFPDAAFKCISCHGIPAWKNIGSNSDLHTWWWNRKLRECFAIRRKFGFFLCFTPAAQCLEKQQRWE